MYSGAALDLRKSEKADLLDWFAGEGRKTAFARAYVARASEMEAEEGLEKLILRELGWDNPE